MKPLAPRIRASALPMAMIFVIVVGIYAVTMPKMSGAVAVRQVLLDRDQRLMTTALAALQVGKSISHYTSILEFRQLLQYNDTLPAPFDRLNGYYVSISFADNDDDPDGNDTPAEQQSDTDGVIVVIATVEDRATDGVTVNKRVRMAMDIRLARLTEYNFTSSNWGNSSGSSLASRHWYGNMLVANERQGLVTTNDGQGGTHPGYNYWRFSGRQYFHGTLHSTGFDGDQNNHEFSGPDAENLIYHHRDNPEPQNRPLPEIPDTQDIDAQLASDGLIYDEAERLGLIIPDNVEVFLHPNGQIWTRPFNSGPADWTPLQYTAGPDAGTYVNQDEATVLIQGKALIRGVVTGRLTIASTDAIMINGSIENPAFNQNHLGLVARNSIYYENRRVSGGEIYDVRPIDTNNWSSGGPTRGNRVTAASPGTATSEFNFIAQPVFDTSPGGEWDQIKGGSAAALNKFGGSVPAEISGWMNTLGQYQEDDYVTGANSDAGRMPEDGALVFASLASGWYISPAVAYPGLSTSWRINSQGGSFEVRGTYSMGIGVDYMATWSMYGGSMTYQVHPAQQATAPDFFLPLVEAYPEFVYGSWRRLE